MNPKERNETIAHLNRAPLDEMPFQEVKKHISSLLKGIELRPVSSMPGSSLFRAVNVKDEPKPTNVSRLSYPRAEFVKGYQRCNARGKPMFYASQSPLTILMELEAKVDDVFYLSTWRTEKLFKMWLLPKVEVRNPNSHSDIVLSVFDTWFTTPVRADFSHRYKLTAAIAEIFSTEPMGGVMYTSVAHKERLLNVALRPKIVDDCLLLRRVSAIQIVEAKDDQSKVTFKELDFSDSFEADGSINWRGKGRDYKGVNVQRNAQGIYEARDEDGKIVDVFTNVGSP